MLQTPAPQLPNCDIIAPIHEDHQVYLVRDTVSGRFCVKKILRVYDREIYRNLMHHPVSGTPRILDLAEEDGCLTVLEEYISGTSLDQLRASHTLTEETVLHVMTGLTEILERLHAMQPPVIHRDIKPSNIILTDDMHVVLLDFNAAKYYSPGAPSDTVLIGTRGYAAPEQYGFGSSSPETDLYALGVMMKELLPPPLSAPLQRVLEKCTQLDPKDRYRSAAELRQALVRLQPEHAGTLRSGLRTFLPPGFRTGTPWKMLTGTAGYLLVVWSSLTLEVQDLAGGQLLYERIICLLLLLTLIFASSDYLGMRRLIPLCRNEKRSLRILGILLLDLLLAFLILSAAAALESVLFSGG